MALNLTVDIWPWDDPDIDLYMTFTKSRSNVKGQLKVKCLGHKVIILEGHKVIVLLYRRLTVHGLDLYLGHLTLRWSWPWPSNDLHKIQCQRSKVTSRSNVKVTRSSYYNVTRSLYYSTDILLSKIETGSCILDFSSWSLWPLKGKNFWSIPYNLTGRIISVGLSTLGTDH